VCPSVVGGFRLYCFCINDDTEGCFGHSYYPAVGGLEYARFSGIFMKHAEVTS
jgi:hypothetical protein